MNLIAAILFLVAFIFKVAGFAMGPVDALALTILGLLFLALATIPVVQNVFKSQ